jgi:hypothetical protein
MSKVGISILNPPFIELFKEVWNVNENLWKECGEEETKLLDLVLCEIYLNP